MLINQRDSVVAEFLGQLGLATLEAGKGWNTFENALIHLPPGLAEIIRERLLLLLDPARLQTAWAHEPNRPVLHRLFPDRVSVWMRDELIDRILHALNIVSVYVQAESDMIREAWTCTADGVPRRYDRSTLQTMRTPLLVVHNSLRHQQFLGQLLSEEGDLRPTWIDTMLLESILAPHGTPPLRVDCGPRPGDGARAVVKILRRQITRLAELPKERLVQWRDAAGPGLRRLLSEIIRHYDGLKVESEPPFPSAVRSSRKRRYPLDTSDVPIEQIGDFLCALPEQERSLVLIPRDLLFLVADVHDVRIIDSHDHYVKEAEISRQIPLEGVTETLKVPLGDLLVYLSAFVRESQEHNQSPHEACMADWARSVVRDVPGLLDGLGKGYSDAQNSTTSVSPRHFVVPLEDILSRNQSLVRYIRERHFDRVLLPSPEVALGALVRTTDERVEGSVLWRLRSVPHGPTHIVSVAGQGEGPPGLSIPSGWRGWLADTPEGWWKLYAVPRDLKEYVKSELRLDVSFTTLTLGGGTRWIHVCQPTDVERVWLTPDTPYRAEYLGQVAGLISPLAKESCVLLVMQAKEEVPILRWALGQCGFEIPSGTPLEQMEWMSRSTRGVVVIHRDQIIRYALQANRYRLHTPFKVVVAESWPVNDPVLVPVPTQRELARLNKYPEQEDIDVETAGDLSPDDCESDLQEQDEQEQDEIGNALTGYRWMTWTETLIKQMEEHSWTLNPYVWATEHLAEEPLLILDSRLPAARIKDLGLCDVKPRAIQFDQRIASSVGELLSTAGRGITSRRQYDDGMPPENEWDNLARDIFLLPGDLFEWQKKELRRIMLSTASR